MLMLPVAGQLPASKTHAARRWTFLPSAYASSPSLGVLTLVQGRRDCDSYGLAVEDGQVLFCKLDGDAEVYGVDLDRSGKPVRCNCKGFSCTKHCKHVDAVRELQADGLLPAPAAVLPVAAAPVILPSTWRPTNSPDLDAF